MLSTNREIFDENEYDSNVYDSVEGEITHHQAWHNLQDLLHCYASPSTQNKDALLPKLTHSLNSLFQLLHQLVEFNALLQAVATDNNIDNSLDRTEIINDGRMILEALTLFGHAPTKLEDFPGQSGLYISMDHSVAINQYTHCRSTISEQCAVSRLNRVQRTILNKRQALAFEPLWGNIVEMQTFEEKSILLCVRYQYSPLQSLSNQANFYHPITANQAGQSSFFARSEARYG